MAASERTARYHFFLRRGPTRSLHWGRCAALRPARAAGSCRRRGRRRRRGAGFDRDGPAAGRLAIRRRMRAVRGSSTAPLARTGRPCWTISFLASSIGTRAMPPLSIHPAVTFELARLLPPGTCAGSPARSVRSRGPGGCWPPAAPAATPADRARGRLIRQDAEHQPINAGRDDATMQRMPTPNASTVRMLTSECSCATSWLCISSSV